jgi:hypothetical protein
MAQFLRPDSNITQTSFTNGFAEIDEASANDSDFAYGANNTIATLEVGLTDPPKTPNAAQTVTVRYRVAKVSSGTLSGTGGTVTVTCSVREGPSTVIATDAARTTTGSWVEYSFTFNANLVSNWNALRLRFVTSASGAGGNARGGAVSWAELEAPNQAPLQGTAALSGAGTTSVSALVRRIGALTLSAAGSISALAGFRSQGSASLSGSGSVSATADKTEFSGETYGYTGDSWGPVTPYVYYEGEFVEASSVYVKQHGVWKRVK